MSSASETAPVDRTRILTYTTLYPNAAQPGHGLFVEHRLRQLVATQPVEARVVAPLLAQRSWSGIRWIARPSGYSTRSSA